MATYDFSKYTLYRWRYVIGYVLVGILLAVVLLFAGLFLPGGLSSQEMTSVIRAEALDLHDPASLTVQNLPYYAAQAGIFQIFGVSIFTVKLPSLILALMSAIGFIVLLRRWFKPNIAVLASLIAVSTGQFLYIAQSGTPSILYIFWPIALLLLGTQITRVKKYRLLWKILFVIVAALSLYTPLGIYPLIAIILAIVLHPHLRNIVRRMPNKQIILVAVLFVLFCVPLAWILWMNPSLGMTLLGLPSQWPIDFSANALTVTRQYFMFWQPGASTIMTPVFGLGTALIMLIGFSRMFRTRDTTRSYLVMIWLALIIPILLLNPGYTSVTFVPSMLLIAAGLMSLISYWYRLFPLNPYARIAGLIPIIVLVGALILSGLARYTYGYHYSSEIAPLFSKDLSLLPSETKQLVVTPKERKFYEAVAKYTPDLSVTEAATADTFTTTRDVKIDTNTYKVTRIITNANSDSSSRFYVYQKIDK